MFIVVVFKEGFYSKMKNFVFREAVYADAEQIVELAYELNLYHNDDMRPCLKAIQADWAHFDAYVVSMGDEIVGFLVGYEGYKFHAAQRRYEIQDVYVKESYRRNGVARILFENVIVEKYGEGLTRFGLGVEIDNHSAQHFYKAMGFSACPASGMRYVLTGSDVSAFIKKTGTS